MSQVHVRMRRGDGLEGFRGVLAGVALGAGIWAALIGLAIWLWE